jgi:hypothetical protein
LFSATMRPIAAMTCPRTGAGTAAQAGWAARAARAARAKVAASASSTRATVSARSAGLTDSTVPAAVAVTPVARADVIVRMAAS